MNLLKFRKLIPLVIIFSLVFLFSCQDDSMKRKPQPPSYPDKEIGRAKNLIVFIGDGMGVPAITALSIIEGQQTAFEQFPVTGLVKTWAANRLVTGSAASATAYATGFKTNYRYVGVDTDGEAVTNITEIVSKYGFKTAVLTTAHITDATPAAFYAHRLDRNMHEEIALDLYHSPLNFFMGGGRKFFYDRTDGKKLLDSLENNGFAIYAEPGEITGSEENVAVFTAEVRPPKVMDGRQGQLKAATTKALDFLSGSRNRFFVMIEGAQIDWGGEEHDQEYLMAEMQDFNDALFEALDFAKNDGETLVLILSDHVTAGFDILDGSLDDRIVEGAFLIDSHTASMVPLFAYGPQAENFSGMMDNYMVFDKMLNALGLKKIE